jgi:tRNA A37 threonylcarbamoyladenosine biosynthesis protein TsaE
MTKFFNDTPTAAREYLARGYKIVPVPYACKGPVLPQWRELNIKPEQMDHYFPQPKMNLGFILGDASNGLVDVDLDCPEAIRLASAFLSETDMIFGRGKTGFKSHRLYRVVGASPKTRQFKAADGAMIVELRGNGAQTVAPPSTHPTGEEIRFSRAGEPKEIEYEVLLTSVGRLAAAVIALRAWPMEGSRNNAALALSGLLLSQGQELESVQHFIRAVTEAAGDEESEARIAVAESTLQKIEHGEPVSGHTQLCEIFGKREVEKMLKHLNLKSAHRVISADSGKTTTAMQKMNDEYALILLGGQATILREPGTNGTSFEFISLSGFETLFRNRKVFSGGKQTTLAKAWLEHPSRRTYDGCTFSPDGAPEGQYNLYRGFAVEPREGDCSKILAHVKENICHSNEDLYRWIIGWFAQIVQHPTEKPGTAIAIRGPQGAGKTIFARYFGSLFGDHYMLVNTPRFIHGRFNGHLTSCLLLHADEGFWAGDLGAAGVLKDMVTNDVQMIELKGKEAFRLPNYIRLLITTNADWVVPAGFEERRFAVLDIGTEKMQNHHYFTAISHEMNNGGREALLDHLLNFDLSLVNLRKIPITDALLEQKLESLEPVQKWWLEVLRRGYLPRRDRDAVKGVWMRECTAEDLLADYRIFTAATHAQRRSTETALGIGLRKLVPGLKRGKLVVRLYNADGEYSAKLQSYEFPELEMCRKAMEKKLGHDMDWSDEEEEDMDEAERRNYYFDRYGI